MFASPTNNVAYSQEKHSILLVDDDPILRDLIDEALTTHNYQVVTADTGKTALEHMSAQHFDLVILDRRLPDCDGLSVLRKIRSANNCPVIVISIFGESQDRLLGLELGADDYINKPINPDEIVLRTKRCIASQSRTVTPSDHFTFGDFKFHSASRKLINVPSSKYIHLSQGEATLLSVFIQNPEKVLNRDFLLNKISHRNWSPYDRTVDVLIARLRRKIEADPRNPEWIITVRGEGYQFVWSRP